MHREGDEIHVDKVEARAGNRGSFVLKILLLSLALLLLAYGVTLLVGASTAPYQPEPVATATPTGGVATP